MSETTHHEWTVRVHCAIDDDTPGPHELGVQSRGAAEARYDWWMRRRPDARPELLRREVVTTYGPWTLAELNQRADEHTEVCR